MRFRTAGARERRYWCRSWYSRGLMVYRSALRKIGSTSFCSGLPVEEDVLDDDMVRELYARSRRRASHAVTTCCCVLLKDGVGRVIHEAWGNDVPRLPSTCGSDPHVHLDPPPRSSFSTHSILCTRPSRKGLEHLKTSPLTVHGEVASHILSRGQGSHEGNTPGHALIRQNTQHR